MLSTQSTPSITEGDVIPDGKIEDSDVNAVTTNLNQPGTGITTDPDLNGDGIITGSDLVIVLTNYGTVSSLNTMLADPSELVTRVSQLTSPDGGLTVEPGIGGPWNEPICEDDTDDIIDGGGGGGGGGRPGIQPGFPGVRPGIDPVIGGGGGPFRSPTLPPTDDDDCPDDDDEDCGCIIPDGAPSDADCDAFADTESASFVGRGMSSDQFFVELTSDEWTAQLIAPGGVLVQSTNQTATSPTRYQGTATFADSAGDAELTWLAYNASTGVIASRCFKVQVVDYTPIEFVYRTFIPCEVVATPLPYSLRWPTFGGDDRFVCATNTSNFAYGGAGGTYRSSYRVEIACNHTILTSDPVEDSTPINCGPTNNHYTPGPLPNLDPPFGLTRAFGAGASTPTPCVPVVGDPACDLNLVPGSVPARTRTHPWVRMAWLQVGLIDPECFMRPQLRDGLNDGYYVRMAPNAVVFRYWLNAADPLLPIAPAIDVRPAKLTLTWIIDKSSGRQEVQWVLSGVHDPYPSHEIYLEQQRAFAFDPAPLYNGPFRLTTPPLIGPIQQFSGSGKVYP